MRFGAAISDAVARSSIVFCNSVCANRIVMAASRLLGAAAACVILSFAAGQRESYWSGCFKAAIVICQQIFSPLALLILLFPRASERRVLLIVGVCQTFSHLHIFTSHLQIFTSSHPHILTYPRCLPLAENLRVQPKKIARGYLGFSWISPPHFLFQQLFFICWGCVGILFAGYLYYQI